jgi:hypothetical protein
MEGYHKGRLIGQLPGATEPPVVRRSATHVPIWQSYSASAIAWNTMEPHPPIFLTVTDRKGTVYDVRLLTNRGGSGNRQDLRS